ncbi:MAG: chloride channel protein [Acetobacteraceae bacterium]|nr:chloride channel protein [Acetobacteraceae bacterium]
MRLMAPSGNTTTQETDARVRTRAAARPRRPFGEAIAHAPQTLRALVRADEIWLVVLAALVGLSAGLVVVAMNIISQRLHEILFLLPSDQRLSATMELEPIRALLVPCLGGLVLGLIGLALARWWPQRTVDAIEANALHGGQMGVMPSLVLVGQTLLSNGVGASVGLEAGYTQISGAMASRLGQIFRVRRSDMRLLVGCGAAAAIAGAFDAPLTGAFFAFELVIGTYAIASLAPVVVAAITAVGVSRLLHMEQMDIVLDIPASVDAVHYIPLLALAMLCALIGIAVMRGVTLTETLFRRSGVQAWMRPAIGGLAVGGLALLTPQVLGSGHGALVVGLHAPYSLGYVAMLIALKVVASAISLGSGFRGGLFFASLFLGVLVGKLFSGLMAIVSTVHAVPEVVCAVVGMSALAVAIVGGPLTMSFLALEITGSLPMTAAVLATSVISALTVRRTFGYSFATWRFHLRGEVIRSAVDIGWMRNLTVGRMMRQEVRTVRTTTKLDNFRLDFPLGSIERLIALDDNNCYAGIVWVAEAHAAANTSPGQELTAILRHVGVALLPSMTIKEAVALFESSESDALAVIDSEESRQVIGALTEQYALRRYSDELERRRRELSGE